MAGKQIEEDGRCGDADITRMATSALRTHPALPGEQITVTVDEGWITLGGQVEWEHQSETAAATVRGLPGVKGVTNLLTAQPHLSATTVKQEIEDALHRTAELEGRHISVDTADSRVILRGNVRAWEERQAAEQAAWRAPGVTQVENKLLVVP
jgi:osmotically-inducible protein OsmY